MEPEFHSTAETRSFGLETVPEAPSPSLTWLSVTPSDSGEPSIIDTSISVSPLGRKTSKNSPMRSIGV